MFVCLFVIKNRAGKDTLIVFTYTKQTHSNDDNMTFEAGWAAERQRHSPNFLATSPPPTTTTTTTTTRRRRPQQRSKQDRP